MKTTTRMLKKLLLLSAVILTSNQMIAQTLPSSVITQSVCIVIEDYEIVPSSNSTYAWSIIDQATGTPPPIGVADIIPTANDWYIQVDWTTPGTYELSVVETDINGCSGAPVIVDVTVNPLDDATFTLTDYCEGSSNSANVTGTTGGVFTFTTPPTGSETINAVTGEITGGIAGTTYSVDYTTPGPDCPQSSTQTVTVNPLDDATFTLTDYCEGSPVAATLIATPGGVFTFTTPPAAGEIIDPGTGEITGGIAGTAYSVTYTTSTGICSQTSAQIVTVNPLPTPGPIWHN